jgi:hypothetical protein
VIISTASATMTCRECQLSGGPFAVDEAALYVATHNRIHHRGAPTAVALSSACGSDNAAAA